MTLITLTTLDDTDDTDNTDYTWWQVDTGPVITGASPGPLRHLNPGSGLYLGDQSSSLLSA